MEDAWELCESQELSVVSDEEPCGEWPGWKPVARGEKKRDHEIYEVYEDC